MRIRVLILGSLGISTIYSICIFAAAAKFNPLNISLDFTGAGQFGDSFGPLNTLMAGVAAVAAVSAYVAQRQELDRIKADSEAERNHSEKRDFETTFFNLLNIFRSAAKDINVLDVYSRNPANRPDPFRRFLSDHIQSNVSDGDIERAYRVAYRNHKDELGHYFRLFYHILRYIDNSSVKDKFLYSRILRATLSGSEIVTIALNCLHGGGKQKLKPLVEAFSMLHNISVNDLNEWNLYTGFDPKAFGDRNLGDRSSGSEFD